MIESRLLRQRSFALRTANFDPAREPTFIATHPRAIMFFITPQEEHLVSSSDFVNGQSHSKKRKQHHELELQAANEMISGYYPRRTPKACDRCRVKKVKCSGGKLCKRCEFDGVVCTSTGNSATEDASVGSRQYHLVEHQRDRLLEILSEIIYGKDENEVTRLRELLSNMGLSTKSLRLNSRTATHDSHAVVGERTIFERVPEAVWFELYNTFADNSPQEKRPMPNETSPVTLVANPLSADVPFDLAAMPFNDVFDFDAMVDWNSPSTRTLPEDKVSSGPLTYHN